MKYLLTLLFCASAFGADIGESKRQNAGIEGRWFVPGTFSAINARDVSGKLPAAIATGTFTVSSSSGEPFVSTSNSKWTLGGAALNFTGSQPFTCATWVRITNTNATAAVIGKYGNLTGGGQWVFYIVAGGRPALMLIRGNYNTARLLSRTTEPIPFALWTHVTTVYPGGSSSSGFAFYVNGQRVAKNAPEDAGSWGTGMASSSVAAVLCGSTETAPLIGEIRDTSVYSRPLSAAEIAALYKEGLR